MDQNKQSGRVTRRTGADPQLPSYMRSNTRLSSGAAGRAGAAAYSGANGSRSGGTSGNGSRSNGTGGNGSRSNGTGGNGSRSNGTGGNGSRNGGANGGSRSGGASQTRRPRKRKPSRAQRLLRIALLVLAALLLVVGVMLAVSSFGDESGQADAAVLQNKTYLDGVSIHGVDVSGKTIEQARDTLQTAVTGALSQINITLTEDTDSWAFTSGDMNISSDLEDVLLEAMLFGREGTLSERAEQKDALEEDGKDFPITFTPDRETLISRLEGIAAEVDRPAIEPHMNASLGEDHTPIFDLQPGENGRALNAAGTADAIVELIAGGYYQGEVPVVYDVIPPTLDENLLRENTQFRAKYTTTFSNSSEPPVPNRVFNIEKAAGIINGCVLQPGESWSFNGYVGLRTLEGGWKEANGISQGKEYTLQAGGGICQVSTTLYNALLCGDIQIDYRRKHSIPSDYVGYGLDCTVDSGGIDMNFTNNTGAPLYIFVYTEKNPERSRRKDITVLLYGEPLPEGVTYKTRSETLEQSPREDTVYVDDATIPYGYMLTKVVPHDKIKAEAYRDKYVDGELVESKLLNTDTYNGNPAEIHVGTGDPLAVPVPTGAVPATVEPETPVPDAYKIAAAGAAAAPGDDGGDEPEFDIPEIEE